MVYKYCKFDVIFFRNINDKITNIDFCIYDFKKITNIALVILLKQVKMIK